MSDKIKVTFREPKYGARSVLYVNGERHGFISLEEKDKLKDKIYNIISEFSEKEKTLKTMRGSK